uniref:Putative ovule protein n=1 Tax=Solanum chacoense TaxID=4108 RepID=A0A0V0GJY0_SOLCH
MNFFLTHYFIRVLFVAPCTSLIVLSCCSFCFVTIYCFLCFRYFFYWTALNSFSLRPKAYWKQPLYL